MRRGGAWYCSPWPPRINPILPASSCTKFSNHPRPNPVSVARFGFRRVVAGRDVLARLEDTHVVVLSDHQVQKHLLALLLGQSLLDHVGILSGEFGVSGTTAQTSDNAKSGRSCEARPTQRVYLNRFSRVKQPHEAAGGRCREGVIAGCLARATAAIHLLAGNSFQMTVPRKSPRS